MRCLHKSTLSLAQEGALRYVPLSAEGGADLRAAARSGGLLALKASSLDQ